MRSDLARIKFPFLFTIKRSIYFFLYMYVSVRGDRLSRANILFVRGGEQWDLDL